MSALDGGSVQLHFEGVVAGVVGVVSIPSLLSAQDAPVAVADAMYPPLLWLPVSSDWRWVAEGEGRTVVHGTLLSVLPRIPRRRCRMAWRRGRLESWAEPARLDPRASCGQDRRRRNNDADVRVGTTLDNLYHFVPWIKPPAFHEYGSLSRGSWKGRSCRPSRRGPADACSGRSCDARTRSPGARSSIPSWTPATCSPSCGSAPASRDTTSGMLLR